jgi:RNA polymerase sigma-70 factor (ECF subfamily)
MRSQFQDPPNLQSSESEERYLIAEVLAKDRKATAEFVARCADCVYPFVRRRLMPRTDLIEDLVQEILLAAWQNLLSFRGRGNLRAWVLGIARHKVEDHYRKCLRQTEVEEEEESETEPALQPLFDEQLDSEAQRQRIDAILAALPEAYGLALQWRYRDSRSTREMAELTGKTEKAMERLLARARESFRKRWLDAGQ